MKSSVFFLCLFSVIAFMGCSDKNSLEKNIDEPVRKEEAKGVDISVSLCSSACISQPSMDAVIIEIKNNRDKPLKILKGNIVFYDSDGQIVGRVKKPIIYMHPGRAKTSQKIDTRIRYTSLKPEENYTLSLPFLALFAGYPELREKAKTNWEDWKTDFEITSIL